MSSEALPKRLSRKDKARLLTNDPRLADRFLRMGGARFPVLHLQLSDYEIFQAVTEPLEALIAKLLEDKLSFADTPEDLYWLLTDDLPLAASLTLRIPSKEAKSRFTPVELLYAVAAQWSHNLEIHLIRELYPMPPKDKDDKEVDVGAPDDNPTSMVESLCSGFHWKYEWCLKRTWPQLYLLSNESAWGYYKVKQSSDDKTPKRKPVRETSIKKPVKAMTAKEYMQHLQEQGIQPEVINMKNPTASLPGKG